MRVRGLSVPVAVTLALLLGGCGKDPAALMEEGKAAFELGLLPAALERYKEVEKGHAQQFPEVFERLGDVYVSMGDLERAFGYWQKALEVRPGDAKLRNKLGAYLLQTGNVEAARQAFVKAAELAPRDHEATFNLGVLELQAGNVPGAIARFEKARELRPGDATVLRHLGIAFSQAGRGEEAADALYQAWKADPDKAGKVELIYKMQLGAQRWAQAVEVGTEIVSGNADPLLIARYAYAVWRAGDEARGRDLYQSLARLPLPPYLESHVKAALSGGVESLALPGTGEGS